MNKSHGGLNLDIDGWLHGIGLAQYAEIFRANDIDGELLRRLTNDDLKDIGVVSFGHRKKLLEAIARRRPRVAPRMGRDALAEVAGANRRETKQGQLDGESRRIEGGTIRRADSASPR
jgi:SAM domain (Sterile alpha motif)